EVTLRDQKARQLLVQKGEQMLETLRSGSSLEALAAESAMEVVSLTEASRNDMEHPRSALELAFAMPKPTSDEAVVDGTLGNGNYVLIELLAVNVPDTGERQEEREAIARSLANMQAAAE